MKYSFDNSLECKAVRLLNQTKENAHHFMDIGYTTNYLVLLEEIEGIYLYHPISGTLEKYPLRFEGRYVKMEVIGTTIEVIGEYFEKRYVAELFLHITDDEEPQIVINRFYNQIAGIRDVDFFDNKAIFIGDDEIMLAAHSTNRNLLLNLSKRQNRQLFLSYGILEFDVI